RETGDHAERTVEGTPVGHGVQVAAGDDAALPRLPDVGVGVTPPGPLVADPVLDQVQPAGGRLAREPLPQRRVLGGPRVAAVATGRPVTAGPGEVTPHRCEGGHSPHSCPSRTFAGIGTRTPRSEATSAARE